MRIPHALLVVCVAGASLLLACGAPLDDGEPDPRFYPLTAGGGDDGGIPFVPPREVPPHDPLPPPGEPACTTEDDAPEPPDPEVAPLDPSYAQPQFDLSDGTFSEPLNASLVTAVETQELAAPPSAFMDDLWDAHQALSGLWDVEDPEEYEDLKRLIYDDIDLEVAARQLEPLVIDAFGGGGLTIDELFREPLFDQPRDAPIDLRVQPEACQDVVAEAAAARELRVYRNLELSQVYARQVCLAPGATVAVETSASEATVDPAIHIWDPQAHGAVSWNDDAEPGTRDAFAWENNGGAQERCLMVLVVNRLPAVAGRTRVRTTVFGGSEPPRETDLEVQLRSFPQPLAYDEADVDFQIALTRYTELPKSPSVVPLMLLDGSELVGFDMDSGVGPAASVLRHHLGERRPTQALVLGRSLESRDFTHVDAYVTPEDEAAFRLAIEGPSALPGEALPGIEPFDIPEAMAPGLIPSDFPPTSPSGRVDLILDAHDVDGDGDFISAATEAQLCTCDPSNRDDDPAAWYTYCEERSSFLTEVPEDEPRWHRDTDHDGMTDLEEVFGVELPPEGTYFAPERLMWTLALPMMGAEPLHKDLFVEIDFLQKGDHEDPHTFGSVRTSVLDAEGEPSTSRRWRDEFFNTIHRRYLEGPNEDVLNPNGLDGIRVHVDIGADPILTNEARENHCAFSCGSDAACLAACPNHVNEERRLHRTRAFGDWGGGGSRMSDAYLDDSTEVGAEARAYLCEELWGLDLDGCVPKPRDYAHLAAGISNPHRRLYFRYGLLNPYAGGGGQAHGPRFGLGLNAEVATHELGHVTGLGHYGHVSWGGKHSNCKPHYVSLMNYAYDYEPSIGFSKVRPSEDFVINPSNVSEVDLLVQGLTPDIVSRLRRTSFQFLVDASEIDADGDGVASIDWNMSGVFDAEPMRAAATWCNNGAGTTTRNRTILAREDDLTAWRSQGAAPDLVRVGEFLYAFYVALDGSIRYRKGVLGPKAKGSCHAQTLEATCMEWDPEVVVPVLFDSESTGVAVTTWDGGLVIAANQRSAGDGCTVTVHTTEAIAASGVVPEPTWVYAHAAACGDIEALTIPVDARVTRGGKLLSVLSRDEADGIVWARTPDPLGPMSGWSRDVAVDIEGNRLRGPFAPGVAVWPAPDYEDAGPHWAERATACGVFPVDAGDGVTGTRLYCLDRRTARWVPKADPEGMESILIEEKPAVAFHLFRGPDGEPLDPTNLPGQLWVAYVAPNEDEHKRGTALWVSSEISLSRPPLDFESWGMRFARSHVGPVTHGSGPALYEDLGLGALKAAVNRDFGYAFHPLADGTFDADLRTGNDFQVMEARLCRSIRSGATYCPPPEHTRFGY